MIYKTIVFILIFALVSIVFKSCSGLLSTGVSVVSSKKMWVKVKSVDVKTREISNKYAGKYISTHWNVTVIIKNQFPTVNMMVGPPPKEGSCLPVIVKVLSNDNILTFFDDQEWRYGASNGSC